MQAELEAAPADLVELAEHPVNTAAVDKLVYQNDIIFVRAIR
jgi:hypothetical protein